MAGILANSASVTMVAGTPDAINGGYIVNEAITLSTAPAASGYEWALAKPQGSTARANLTATTGTGISFVPDTHGVWTITCLVDGVTAYVLRVGVEAVAVTTHGDASRYIPVTDATVPTPALGATLFYSRTGAQLSYKDSAGAVYAVASRAPTRIDSTDSPYAVLVGDRHIFADTDGGAITVNLPAGVAGREIRIVNVGSAAADVTVTPNGAELLRGVAASQTLTDGQQLALSYEATEGWW